MPTAGERMVGGPSGGSPSSAAQLRSAGSEGPGTTGTCPVSMGNGPDPGGGVSSEGGNIGPRRTSPSPNDGGSDGAGGGGGDAGGGGDPGGDGGAAPPRRRGIALRSLVGLSVAPSVTGRCPVALERRGTAGLSDDECPLASCRRPVPGPAAGRAPYAGSPSALSPGVSPGLSLDLSPNLSPERWRVPMPLAVPAGVGTRRRSPVDSRSLADERPDRSRRSLRSERSERERRADADRRRFCSGLSTVTTPSSTRSLTVRITASSPNPRPLPRSRTEHPPPTAAIVCHREASSVTLSTVRVRARTTR